MKVPCISKKRIKDKITERPFNSKLIVLVLPCYLSTQKYYFEFYDLIASYALYR